MTSRTCLSDSPLIRSANERAKGPAWSDPSLLANAATLEYHRLTVQDVVASDNLSAMRRARGAASVGPIPAASADTESSTQVLPSFFGEVISFASRRAAAATPSGSDLRASAATALTMPSRSV